MPGRRSQGLVSEDEVCLPRRDASNIIYYGINNLLRRSASVLGASWTWYAQDYDKKTMDPQAYDYSSTGQQPGYLTGDSISSGNEEFISIAIEIRDQNGSVKERLSERPF